MLLRSDKCMRHILLYLSWQKRADFLFQDVCVNEAQLRIANKFCHLSNHDDIAVVCISKVRRATSSVLGK